MSNNIDPTPETYKNDENDIEKLKEKYPAILGKAEISEDELRNDRWKISFSKLKDNLEYIPKIFEDQHLDSCNFNETNSLLIAFEDNRFEDVKPMLYYKEMAPRNGQTMMEIIGNEEKAKKVKYAFMITKRSWEKHPDINEIKIFEHLGTDFHKFFHKELQRGIIKRRALKSSKT